jgi:hypothetical protein
VQVSYDRLTMDDVAHRGDFDYENTVHGTED